MGFVAYGTSCLNSSAQLVNYYKRPSYKIDLIATRYINRKYSTNGTQHTDDADPASEVGDST